MSLPSFSIKRPVTMLMIYTILVLLGVLTLLQLPVELYPNVSFGEVSIIIEIRGGMPPTEVETLVAKPIEEAVGTVSHLEEMLSISKEGECTVVLSFEPGIDMNFAALDVREKFARVKNKLPKEIERPVIAQFKRSDVPILILAVTSLRRSTEEIRKIVDESVRQAVKRVSGVADAEVAGGRERKILVEADQRKMAAYSVPLERVISMISLNNLNLLSGDIERRDQKYLIRAIGLYQDVEDIKRIPVSTLPDGTIIRLQDIATVLDSYLEPTGYARVNVRPVVSIYVQKESTANTIAVARLVEIEVEKLRSILPSDIHVSVISNQADFIKRSIDNLKGALLQGGGLVMLVLAYFLVNFRKIELALVSALLVALLFLPSGPLYVVLIAMLIFSIMVAKYRPVLIVTSAIPISVIITFSLMWSMRLSINFMTLFGLALGVGMLVDNSIVVFENMLRHNEEGLKAIPAAIKGAEEVWIAIWASTLTTVIVFLPMAFVGEEIKLLYSGVAWTVTFSLVTSLFVSITMVPLFTSRMRFSIKDIPKGYGKSGISSIQTSFMRFLYNTQKKGMFLFLRNRFRMLLYAAIAFVISLVLFLMLGKEFLGTTEQNKFTIFIEMPTGTKLDITNSVVKKVEALVKEIPEVKTFSARVEPWSSKVYVELVSVTKRKRTVAETIESLRPKVEKIKPAFIYFEEEQEVGTKEIVVELFGYEYDKLREIAIAMATRLGGVRGFTDTKIRMREGRPELGLMVDRKKAGLFDMNVSDVADSVHAQMRGLRATLFHTESSEVETIARLDEKYRKTFKDVHKLVLTNKDEDAVFLDQIVDFKYGLGPSEIWRKNKARMIQVSSNIGRSSLSKAAVLVRGAFSDLKLPEGYFYRLGGNYPKMIAVQKQIVPTIILVVILIYLVLAALFESYIQPLIIMMSVPLALIGVVIALYATGKTVGMGVFVGLMMLGGIVVNNAILLIDHINMLRRKGTDTSPSTGAVELLQAPTKSPRLRERYLSPYKAAVVASRDRLRPILMTTITTLLGLLPMALNTQEGSNLWSPLAITVIGGLLSSTILTLLIVPCGYTIAEDASVWVARIFTKNNVTDKCLQK